MKFHSSLSIINDPLGKSCQVFHDGGVYSPSNADLKQLVQKRQLAFASGDKFLFKLLRSKVNRERKRCRAIYYDNKVRDLKKDTTPCDWWREVKQLCGNGDSAGKDIRSML